MVLSAVVLLGKQGTCELELHKISMTGVYQLYSETHIKRELMRARTRTDLASHAQRTQQTINPDVRSARNRRQICQCQNLIHGNSARASARISLAARRPGPDGLGARSRTVAAIITRALKWNYQATNGVETLCEHLNLPP